VSNPTGDCIFRSCSPLTFIPSHINKLLTDHVRRRKAVLHVGLEDCQIPEAALHQIPVMMPEKIFESLGGNAVDTPLALIGDRNLKPVLHDPEDDFRLTNVESACQAFH